MQDSVSIACPHCGEENEIAIEPTDGATEFVTDCTVCCRPMTIKLRIVDGEIEEQEVSGE